MANGLRKANRFERGWGIRDTDKEITCAVCSMPIAKIENEGAGNSWFHIYTPANNHKPFPLGVVRNTMPAFMNKLYQALGE